MGGLSWHLDCWIDQHDPSLVFSRGKGDHKKLHQRWHQNSECKLGNGSQKREDPLETIVFPSQYDFEKDSRYHFKV